MSTTLTRFIGFSHEEGIVHSLRRYLNAFFSLGIRTSYVYETVIKPEKEADYLPRIKRVTFVVLESPEQLDYLLKEDYDLSLLDLPETRLRLKKGCIGFLIFVGKELGFRGWAGLSKEAREMIDRGYKVNFDKGEACFGGDWTNPKYRGNRFQTYANYKKREYVREKGIKLVRSTVTTSNAATQKMNAQDKMCAKIYYVRILGLRLRIIRPVRAADQTGG